MLVSTTEMNKDADDPSTTVEQGLQPLKNMIMILPQPNCTEARSIE